MAKVVVDLNDTIAVWRDKTNTLGDQVGDTSGLTTAVTTDLVAAINAVDSKPDVTTAGAPFAENVKATFGTDSDLAIYHDGTNSYIENKGAGSLYLSGSDIYMRSATGETYAHMDANGPTTLFFNSLERIVTTVGGAEITGTLTANSLVSLIDLTAPTATINGTLTADTVKVGDNDKIMIGTGDDLQIYHDGSNNYIRENTGGSLFVEASDLHLRSSAQETYLRATADGAVDLFHNNVQVFETTTTGVNVIGDFTVNGLPPAQLTPVAKDDVFWQTKQNITSVASLDAGYNAVNAGPVTIGPGGDVTIASGSVWTIV